MTVRFSTPLNPPLSSWWVIAGDRATWYRIAAREVERMRNSKGSIWAAQIQSEGVLRSKERVGL